MATATATTTALVIILVMAAASATAVTIATMAAATAATVTTMATASAATTTAVMRLIKQLVHSGVADLNDLAREAKNLTCQFMVEIESHCFIRDAKHSSDDTLPLIIEHRHLTAKDEKLLAQVTIGPDKDILGDINNRLGETWAISLIRRQRETELITGLEVGNLLLESGEHPACAIDEAEGAGVIALLHKWAVMAVGVKLIDERYIFVLLDIHFDLV